MTPTLDILDIGSGCGDSTACLSKYEPRTLTGVTGEDQQSEVSRQRFPHVTFIHADAVRYVKKLESESVDRVFALDCAYHFSSRQRFQKEVARALRHDGKLVMTDLILADNVTPLDRIYMRIICSLTGSPFSNFTTLSAYHQHLRDVGFHDVQIEDISKDTFPGLERFIKRHDLEMGRYGITLAWGKWNGYLAFGRILKWWSTGVVKFIVITAGKGQEKKQ